jgi:hypothetical protein
VKKPVEVEDISLKVPMSEIEPTVTKKKPIVAKATTKPKSVSKKSGASKKK